MSTDAPGHALTFRIGGWLTDLDVRLGKTCACMNCLRAFFDMEDADATPCGGGTR